MTSIIADEIEQHFSPKIIDFEAMETNVVSAIADNLNTSRKSVQMSQSAMAKVFGVSLSQYKKYEQGLESIKIDSAQKWSLRFGMPFFHLLKDSDYQLPFNDLEDRLNSTWFQANSLTHEYFLKLVDIVHLFANNRLSDKTLELIKIEASDMQQAITEIDNDIYIVIAKGLKNFRHRFSISQEQLSEYLGISKSTLQQYEKESMKPRFSMTMASRFYLSTGISPLALLKGTKYSQIRYMQEQRMEVLLNIAVDIGVDKLEQMRPLVDGFFDMVRTTPKAMLIR